ncbi:hypothetical protein MASR2M74_27370 [Paracoccaceae bacterium]
MAATALLYLGPLLAGLAGFGWPLVYAFAAIFTLWLITMRPGDWPRDLAAWCRPEVPVRALGQVVVQLLLVALMFGIGRGIGGVAGFLPPLPVALPLGMSLMSIPLSRLVWDPVKAAKLDAVLTDALAQIEARPRPTLPGGMIDSFLAELDALPDDAPEAVARLVHRGIEELDPCLLKTRLLERVAQAPRRADWLALILQATEGTATRDCSGDYPTRCLQLLPDDPALVALYAEELARSLALDPDLWGDCPNPDTLQERIDRLSGTEAEAPLLALLALTERLSPED